MTLWRHGETTTGPTARRNTNLIAAVCPCGRSIRVAASTLAEAPITCQACDQRLPGQEPGRRLSVNTRLRLITRTHPGHRTGRALRFSPDTARGRSLPAQTTRPLPVLPIP